MNARFNYLKVAPGTYEAMRGLEKYLKSCGLEEPLVHLIKLRASQLNGCAYCLDMHWKNLRALGETEQRLYSLDAWRECPYYSERERAALAFFTSNLLEQLQAGKLQEAEAAAACRMLDQAGYAHLKVSATGGVPNLHGYPRAVTT